jgi:hypothetical protein
MAQLRELTYPCPDCGEWCLREELKCNPQLAIWMAGGGAPDLNIAEVNALIDARLFELTRNQRWFSMDYPLAGLTNVGGIRSVGFVDKYIKGDRVVDTGPGIDKIFEVYEYYVTDPYGLFTTPFKYRMLQNAANLVGGYAGEVFQGIQWGSFQTVPPWQTTYATSSPATSAVLQLRYNFTLTRFEVCVWDTDTGTPPDIVACDINPLFQADFHKVEFRMDLTPGDPANSYAGSVLRCYLNGQLAKTYTGQHLDNAVLVGTTDGIGAGYFVTSGSNGSLMTEAGFYSENVIQQFLPTIQNAF